MKLKRTECFKIRVFAMERFDLEHPLFYNPVKDIRINGLSVNKNPVRIAADPFLFVKGERLFLFYEEKKRATDGVIRMTSTTDLKHWTPVVTVLEESFHLSFPWVFEENGKIYMLPETSSDHSVRLYQADDDTLTSFSLCAKLLQNKDSENEVDTGSDYVDSTILEHKGVYYLWTSVRRCDRNILELYFSDEIEGPYMSHPRSPIVSDNKYGRNAGSIIEMNGGIFRLAQNCEVRYGDNVNLLRITKLDECDYEECQVMDNMFSSSVPFFRQGGHQLNFVRFMGKTVVAVDAKEYNTFFLSRCTRTICRVLNIK